MIEIIDLIVETHFTEYTRQAFHMLDAFRKCLHNDDDNCKVQTHEYDPQVMI